MKDEPKDKTLKIVSFIEREKDKVSGSKYIKSIKMSSIRKLYNTLLGGQASNVLNILKTEKNVSFHLNNGTHSYSINAIGDNCFNSNFIFKVFKGEREILSTDKDDFLVDPITFSELSIIKRRVFNKKTLHI